MNNFIYQDNFDPKKWANTDTIKSDIESMPQEHIASQVFNDDLTTDKIKAVAATLVRHGIDITDGYDNWFHVAKALANELGEYGRGIFHELSKQNPQYNIADCDKKYDQCLRDSNDSISIGTFFQLAKDHGVDISAIGKEVFLEKRPKMDVSATYAIAPIGGSSIQNMNSTNSEIDTSIYIKGVENITPDGGVAEVAEMDKTFGQLTTAYTFSDKINPDHLVGIFRDIYEMHKAEPAICDTMLLGALNTISGLMGGANGTVENRCGVYGVYDGRRVYAPLYNIVYSGAGNEKGNLVFCKHLAHDVKNEMRKQYEAEKQKYEDDLAEYNARTKVERGSAPKEPVFRTPFIPGNSTSSAVYRILDANGGWGMMFETEADTVSNMIGSEYGNYSDLMRKAHHHETLSMERVKENLHVEIEEPRLSIFLTCTPDQLPKLLPSFENGLGSRFLYYYIPEKDVNFHDVFALEKTPLEDVYKAKSYQVSALYHALKKRVGHPIQFTMSDRQRKIFLETYQDTLKTQFRMLGKGIRAFVFRMALENFRIAMVLSVMRRLEEFWKRTANNTFDCSAEDDAIFDEMENALTCSDEDFETAMEIVGCLIFHTARVYAVMGKEEKNPFADKGFKPTPIELAIYNSLPTEFKTSLFIETAMKNGSSQRSAERMLSKMSNEYLVLIPIKQGLYRKAPLNED